jgi:hypothetical protein
VCSDQATGSNKHKNVIIDSQHKREVVKSKMCAESLTSSKHKGEVMGSLVKRRGLWCLRRQTRQWTKGKLMVGTAESPSNSPLWVKLDFKVTQTYKFFLSPSKLYTFHYAAFVSIALPQTSMSQFYAHTM